MVKKVRITYDEFLKLKGTGYSYGYLVRLACKYLKCEIEQIDDIDFNFKLTFDVYLLSKKDSLLIKLDKLEEKRMMKLGRLLDIKKDLIDYDGYESFGQEEDDRQWCNKLELEIAEIDQEIKKCKKALEVEDE